MTKLQKQIADLEALAADSELIANLTTDKTKQLNNAEKAKRLMRAADVLRQRDTGGSGAAGEEEKHAR